MKNIVLTGYMASGKTTTARELSRMTGRKMVDTDDMVVESEGMSISDIFEKFGEEYFRKSETDAVKRASAMDGVIIATGGGAVLRHENIEALRKNGVVFNLEPSETVIKGRTERAREGRPLLAGAELSAILKRFEERRKFYDDCDVKIKVESGRSVREIADEILEQMRIRKG